MTDEKNEPLLDEPFRKQTLLLKQSAFWCAVTASAMLGHTAGLWLRWAAGADSHLALMTDVNAAVLEVKEEPFMMSDT